MRHITIQVHFDPQVSMDSFMSEDRNSHYGEQKLARSVYTLTRRDVAKVTILCFNRFMTLSEAQYIAAHRLDHADRWLSVDLNKWD